MFDYYDEKLSASKLKHVYEVATPRVRQYLNAEIEYVLRQIGPHDAVLELGCGYGRVLPPLAERAKFVVGIDNSAQSLQLARRELAGWGNIGFARMDAASPGIGDQSFDAVLCIQNGISAFHVDRRRLVAEAIRITKRGGVVLFSSYADSFWEARLEWFEIQANAGLLGEIDHERTHDGVIVCKDGFTADTVRPQEFVELCAGFGVEIAIAEVDESSLFATIKKG